MKLEMPHISVRILIALVVATVIYVAILWRVEMSMYAKGVIAILLYLFFTTLAAKPKWIPDVIASLFYS